MTKRFLAGALLLLAFVFDAGAQSLTRSLSDGKPVRHLPEPGQVIIEFTAAPLLSRDTKASADLDQLFARLERDLAAIEGSRAVAKASGSEPLKPLLRHRYSRAFAGASATVSPESRQQIRELSYVRTVHPDRVVTALLQESVEQVGAPTVWQDYGARGSGVVVAVIDTGIDYTHPAFGGGFGAGHKVRGGRDLVNNDSDPMDDHGHGTHVGGIVAANGGGLTGVAPEATLLAYKALDASGSGRDSYILAAIEEAVRERADIVNMSLGRPAVADDPVVRAIDNAAASGMLFCVAAGNSGAFLDIGSPGNAPSAITVGAIDRDGRLAYFSSKGPVVPTGAMKPEIVAPGVQIVSARNGGGLRTASGTSMAAPHVAGVAALLRDVHPEWSLAMLRAALINGARVVEAEVMAAGAGSVHAGDAARKNLDPSANSLSFGISDQAQQPWVAARTITLTNRSDAAQTLLLAIDGLAEGIVLTPSATSITISPGASASIDVELRLDHSKVPSPEFGSLSFGGFLRFTGDQGSISIPWSFVKASRVRVRWTGSEIAHVKVATAHMIVLGSTTPPVSSRVDLFIGAGDASLWVQGESAQGTLVHHVIRENIDLSGPSELVIDPSHAPHEIRFAGTDVHGRPLSDRGKLSMRDVLILHPHFATDLFESIFYLSSDQRLFFSTLPPATRLLAFERAFDADPAVTWSAQYEPVTSVDGDVDLTIAPGAWKSISARGVIPTGLEHPYQTIFAGLWITAGRYSLASITRPNVDPPAISGDTAIEAWVTSPTAGDSRTGILVEIGDGPSGPETSPLSSPELMAEFTATDDGIIPGHDQTPRISSRVIPSQERFSIGDGPAYPNAMISGSRDMMSATIRWSGPHGEDRIYDAKRTKADLYDASGDVIASGTPPTPTPGVLLGPSPGFQMFSPLPSPGAYTLQASTSSFNVAGLPARGTLRAAFNTEKSDPAPPTLTSLRIDDGNGRTTASVMNPAQATLTFSAVDLGAFGFGDIQRDRTAVQLRPHGAGDGAWSSVTPVVLADDFGTGSSPTQFRFPDGVLYSVNLGAAGAPMKGAVDVRIRVEDAEGNSAEYTVEPAFVVTPSRRRAASN